jgi:cell wall-associated NlpC family hydrolase
VRSDPRRELVIAEARAWLRTPYHHQQRVRGAGVDCGQFPLAVYEAAGVIPHVDVPHYPADFAMHSEEEWYLRIVERFAREVEAPRPGEFAIWQWGKTFSHGAIVIDWPTIIHSWALAVSRDLPTGQVIEMSAESAKLKFIGKSGKPRPVKFFSPFAD